MVTLSGESGNETWRNKGPLAGHVHGACWGVAGAVWLEGVAHLDLNVLGVDHLHDAHHIVKHQAKLLTVVYGEKSTPLNIHSRFIQKDSS